MSDLYKHLDAIRKIADETFKPIEVKENPETDYEGSFDYELYGDDGETAYGKIHYKAVNGKVDPKSLQGEYEYEGNARVDSDLATQMIQPGGDEHEEALKAAQEDYDYETQRMQSKVGETNDIEDESTQEEGYYKEMDTVKKEKARLMAKLKDLKAKYNAQMAGAYAGDPETTETEIEKIEKELGMSQESINTEAMKKDINEAITMTAETPEEASVLMQILKLAGVKPVDDQMINQPEVPAEQPAHNMTAGDQMRSTIDKVAGPETTEEEFANEPNVDYQSTNDLVNTHSGGLNRQKIQVKKGYPGDNDMAESNDLEQLANRLREEYNSLYKKVENKDLNDKPVEEKVQSPYAVGMAQAMKATGDKPPLEKSTIKKAHDIAKAVEKNQ